MQLVYVPFNCNVLLQFYLHSGDVFDHNIITCTELEVFANEQCKETISIVEIACVFFGLHVSGLKSVSYVCFIMNINTKKMISDSTNSYFFVYIDVTTQLFNANIE